MSKKSCTFASHTQNRRIFYDSDAEREIHMQLTVNQMFNFTQPHVANGHYLEGLKIVATHK